MVKHTQLRKFNIWFIFLLFISLNLLEIQQIHANSSKIPVLHQIGIIPAHWQSSDEKNYQDEKLQTQINVEYFNAVKKSNRFAIINDDLIKELWKTPTGRNELINDFELSAFTSLNIVPTNDTYTLSARILNPKLEVLLLESKTIEKNSLDHFKPEQISAFVQDLIYKLFNKLPVDASVTSIQGRYITISGGQNQGLSIGDQFQIVRASVVSQHPADRSWLEFYTQNLGKAKIIDVKSQTSVAQILELTKENVIEIGDGAKLKSIVGRSNFARKEQQANSQVKNDTIIVPPLYIDGKPNEKVKKTQNDTNKEVEDKKPESSPVAHEDSKKTPESEQSTSVPPPTQPQEGNNESMFPIGIEEVKGAVGFFADDITLSIGQKWWWYNGPGADGTTVKWYYPINEIGARIKRQIMQDIKYDIGGGIGWGATHSGGNYFAYDSHVRIYMEKPLYGIPEVKKWKAGAQGSFTGLGVKGSPFGGYDYIMGGVFGGLEGNMILNSFNVDWFGEFSLKPLTFGRLGYKGSRKTIGSSFGWHLSLGGFLTKQRNEIEWGGAFNYGGQNVTDSENKVTGISTISLQGLARYRF